MQHALFVNQDGKYVTHMKCAACDLCKNPKLVTNCMSGAGSANATFMFVGQSPGQEDDSIGSPMTGSNGRLLRSLLSEAGFDLNDCFFSNCLRCCGHGRKPTKTMWNACREHFLEEYYRIKPRFLISLGGDALQFLTGQSGVKRLSRKAVPSEFDQDVRVYPMRQPAMLMHAKGDEAFQLRRLLVDDLVFLHNRKFLSEDAAQYDIEQNLDYQIARTEEDAVRMLDELEQYSTLACDLETTNLGKPKDHDAILAVGFSFGKGVGRAFPFDCRGVATLRWWDDDFLENTLRPRIQKLLREKDIFGQNFIQYDQLWLRDKLGIDKLDIKYDTILAHYCIDEEPGTHSLESQAMEYTSMSPWKTEFIPDDAEKLLGYLNKDVDATWRIREVIEPMLNDRQQWLLQNLLIPLSQELFEIEHAGIRVDEEQIRDLDSYLTKRTEETLAKIRADEPVRKWELANNINFNPNSPKQLAPLLKESYKLPLKEKTESGGYSTSKAVLESFDDVEICQDVLSYRRLQKLYGTYVAGARDRLRDGKLHTSFSPFTTVTGRLASYDPNLQTIPRADTAGAVLEDGDQIKRMFVPRQGWVFLQQDLSQAELRVLACLSGDERMIQIFQDGKDIHSATAAAASGIELEDVTKPLRSAAKKLSFGIVYGMSEDTLIEEFIKLGNSQAAAEEFLRNHKRQFPRVWEWMNEQERIIRSTGVQTTYFGRSRRYDVVDARAIRQAYNFPIQSTTSDITLLALVRCAKQLRARGYSARIVLTVHDSIVFEIPMHEFADVVQLSGSIMEGMEFPWLKVPMIADAEAGTSWGDLKPLDWRTLKFLED